MKLDSFPRFPCKSTVQLGTEACLTSEFGMGSGEPSPYDRPTNSNIYQFKNISNLYEQFRKYSSYNYCNK